MKILIIQHKMIGDVLLSSILVEFLKQNDTNISVDYLVNENTVPVVQNNPFIDQIISFKPTLNFFKKGYWHFISEIKNKNYDIVYDVYCTLNSQLTAYLSGAKERISYNKKYAQLLSTKTISLKTKVYTNAGNALENRLRLVCKENEIPHNIIKPKIYLADNELNEASFFLEKNAIDLKKPIVMVSVLGSSLQKTYPFEYMAQILDELVVNSKDVQVLFNYIPSQKNDAFKIFNLTKKETQQHIFINVFASSLRSFLGVLKYCTFLFGNEGGAVNMAKALGIPTFTIFSPWVKKQDWNMFEDGVKHQSVHLKDFLPKKFEGVEYYKSLKKESNMLYTTFKPSFFSKILQTYVSQFLKVNV